MSRATVVIALWLCSGCGNEVVPEEEAPTYATSQGPLVYDQGTGIPHDEIEQAIEVATKVASQRDSQWNTGMIRSVYASGYPHVELRIEPGPCGDNAMAYGCYSAGERHLWAVVNTDTLGTGSLAHELCHFFIDADGEPSGHPDNYFGRGGILAEIDAKLSAAP